MIVTELIQIQKQRGLTDSQFAESLSIHKVSWYRNKRTKVIGSDVLLRAFEVYPEMKEKFLSSFASNKSIEVKRTPPSQTAQNQNLGALWGKVIVFLRSFFSRS